jgi:hypothetical protein
VITHLELAANSPDFIWSGSVMASVHQIDFGGAGHFTSNLMLAAGWPAKASGINRSPNA